MLSSYIVYVRNDALTNTYTQTMFYILSVFKVR